jgi:hypothetical protein
MTTTTTPAAPAPPEGTRLTDAQLGEMMRLVAGADSVELKASVPTGAQRATILGLPMDPVEAQPRQVFFFDTPDLALNKAGLVVRARRRQGGTGDTVIKLRPVVPADLPASLRKQADFNVEVDALPGGFVCSASFKGRTDGQEIRRAVGGEMPLRRLFSKTQRQFYRDHAPAGIELDSLTPLGPTFILKARFDVNRSRKSLLRELVAEMWLYPDGSRILELSTKCAPGDALTVAMEARAYLLAHGVDLGGEQQTKTKTALEFFAKELSGEAQALGAGTRT